MSLIITPEEETSVVITSEKTGEAIPAVVRNVSVNPDGRDEPRLTIMETPLAGGGVGIAIYGLGLEDQPAYVKQAFNELLFFWKYGLAGCITGHGLTDEELAELAAEEEAKLQTAGIAE